MKLRIAIGFGVGLALLVALVVPAGADFQFVRNIPAPSSRCGTDHATGLDYEPEQNLLYLTVMCPDSAGLSSSYFYGIGPGDGGVNRSADFVGAPPNCQDDDYHTISCASHVMGSAGISTFWVGDTCGGIMRFNWWGEGDIGLEDTVAYFSLVDLAPEPVGLEMEFGTGGGDDILYIADDHHQWIVVYDITDATVIDLISLPAVEVMRYVCSVTLYRDHLFVACMIAGGEILQPIIYEITKAGDCIGTHGLLGGRLWPDGIAFVGDSLYVAGPWDSIRVYAPVDFTSEVPGGDSVVVNAVPDEVMVTFDSVSTAGLMSVAVADSDSCSAPPGVTLFSKAYFVTTDAQFDYATEVELGTTGPLPSGVDSRRVRVFVRPSGPCETYRDITTAYTEVPTSLELVFSNLTRTKSEDDEFSVFALGEDMRRPEAVVELKFGYLESAIDGGADSIPSGVLTAINGLLDGARGAYYRGLSDHAAVLVDSIAAIVRATPEIPHTYDPAVPNQNLAGRLISDSHTLSFSLRFSADQAHLTQVNIAPECVNFSYDGWIRAKIEVPPGLDPHGIDTEHVYLMHAARAVPDSVGVGDYDGDSALEVRAVFRTAAVKAALGGPGSSACRLTCFIDGYEVYGDVAISWLAVNPNTLGGATYRAGSPTAVTGLTASPNPSRSLFAIEFSQEGQSPVHIAIYSVKGELVKTLWAAPTEGGTVAVTWAGDNRQGGRVSPGTYFVIARQADRRYTKKIILEP